MVFYFFFHFLLLSWNFAWKHRIFQRIYPMPWRWLGKWNAHFYFGFLWIFVRNDMRNLLWTWKYRKLNWFEILNEILRKLWKIRKFMVEIFATGWPGSQSFADLDWSRTNVGRPDLAAASPRPLRQSMRVASLGPGSGRRDSGGRDPINSDKFPIRMISF